MHEGEKDDEHAKTSSYCNRRVSELRLKLRQIQKNDPTVTVEGFLSNNAQAQVLVQEIHARVVGEYEFVNTDSGETFLCVVEDVTIEQAHAFVPTIGRSLQINFLLNHGTDARRCKMLLRDFLRKRRVGKGYWRRKHSTTAVVAPQVTTSQVLLCA